MVSSFRSAARRLEPRLAEAVFMLATIVLAVAFLAVGTGRAATHPPRNAQPAPTAVAAPDSAAWRVVPLPRQEPARATPASQPPARQQPVDPWARFGFDISWPQCTPQGPVLPPSLGPIAMVGISGGRPMTVNRCLAAEWRWAQGRSQHAGYVNLAAPPTAQDPGAYGAATVRAALAAARQLGIAPRGVWLDVEVANHWSADAAANVAVIRGAAAAAEQAGVQPGIYSSLIDWTLLTGNAAVELPEWRAIPDGRRLAAACTQMGFGGKRADLVQAVFSTSGHDVDGNLRCTDDTAMLRLLSGADASVRRP